MEPEHPSSAYWSALAPPNSTDHSNPNVGVSKVDVNESLKQLEEFEAYFTKLHNGNVVPDIEQDFKFFTYKEQQYITKKLDILRRLVQGADLKPRKSMPRNASGVITSSKASNTYLISTRFPCKSVPKIENLAERRELEMKAKQNVGKPQNLVESDSLVNEEYSSTKPIPPPTSSLRASGVIEKQKRSFNGIKKGPKAVKWGKQTTDEGELDAVNLLLNIKHGNTINQSRHTNVTVGKELPSSFASLNVLPATTRKLPLPSAPPAPILFYTPAPEHVGKSVSANRRFDSDYWAEIQTAVIQNEALKFSSTSLQGNLDNNNNSIHHVNPFPQTGNSTGALQNGKICKPKKKASQRKPRLDKPINK